jgi:hypothetical protein
MVSKEIRLSAAGVYWYQTATLPPEAQLEASSPASLVADVVFRVSVNGKVPMLMALARSSLAGGGGGGAKAGEKAPNTNPKATDITIALCFILDDITFPKQGGLKNVQNGFMGVLLV